MPLVVQQTTKFRKDVKRMRRRGANIKRLEAVVLRLVVQEALPEQLRDHALTGNWQGFRECHLQPDWLLIYRVEGDELQLARTGSYAELFG